MLEPRDGGGIPEVVFAVEAIVVIAAEVEVQGRGSRGPKAA